MTAYDLSLSPDGKNIRLDADLTHRSGGSGRGTWTAPIAAPDILGHEVDGGAAVPIPPGPILVTGNRGTGKTAIAARIARAASLTRRSGDQLWLATAAHEAGPYAAAAPHWHAGSRTAAETMLSKAAEVLAARQAHPGQLTAAGSLLLVADSADIWAADPAAAPLTALRALAASGPDARITVVATCAKRGVFAALAAAFTNHIVLTGVGIGFVITPGGDGDEFRTVRFLPPRQRQNSALIVGQKSSGRIDTPEVP